VEHYATKRGEVHRHRSLMETEKTMDQDITLTRYGLGRIITVGWEQYWQHFRSILPIFLIVYIPINIGLSFVPVDYLVEQHGLRGFKIYMKLIQLTEFLIGVVATMSLARLIEASLLGQPITWQQALRQALSRWGASIGTGLLAGLIILGMCLLLIVPGIIWSLYYSLFMYAVALRGLSGKKALDYSKAIVKGQWWRVFGYLLVINILGAVAGIAVAAPFFFTPDNRILDIASDTLTDIVSALFLTMTTVFFLNNDQMKMKSEPATPPYSEPAARSPQG
jgi:hypothetical protein